MSDGTPEDVVEAPANETADEQARIDGFAAALKAALPNAQNMSDPEPAAAVETSDVEETPAEPEAPESEATEVEETPETEETGADEDKDEETDAEQTFNFDGFDDDTRTNYERLLKDGHVTPEFVEQQRINTLFHAAFTKKTMALAKERKDFAAEREKLSEEIKLLDTIKKDKRYNDAWNRMVSDDFDPDESDEDSGDLVSRKEAARIADERLKAREAEREARSAQEQKKYDDKAAVIGGVMREAMETLSIDQPTLIAYLEAEESLLPPGTDPILHFTPEDLAYRLGMRHRLASAEAKAAAAEARLSKKASKAARAAKQSMPPTRRVSANGETTPWERTKAALNIQPGLANVTGIGNVPGN